MRYVECGELRSSVLGFGCGAVMGRVGRTPSLRAMHLAFDAGINLFDTARSYGYGDSEAVLGDFLRTRRDQVILSTKFGILPQRSSNLRQFAKPAVRALLRLAPSARNLVQRQLANASQPNHFTVAALRSSLDESLRQLRIDYVDLLFLHEPPASVLARDDLFAELDSLRAAGKIRRAGISAAPDLTRHLLRQGVPATIGSLQFATNLANLETTTLTQPVAALGLFLLANHPFGGLGNLNATTARLTSLATDPSLSPDLHTKLRASPIRQLLPDILFNLALRNTGIHAVVPSMLHEENLRANLAAITSDRFTDTDLAQLRSALAAPK